MEEKDYIMRLIHELTRSIIKLIFNTDEEKPELIFEDTTGLDHYNKYIEMADKGQINEAENLLYKDRDVDNPECLKAALLFYNHINDYSDETLTNANYSRVEIKDGIDAALQDFGYNGFDGISMLDDIFAQ